MASRVRGSLNPGQQDERAVPDVAIRMLRRPPVTARELLGSRSPADETRRISARGVVEIAELVDRTFQLLGETACGAAGSCTGG